MLLLRRQLVCNALLGPRLPDCPDFAANPIGVIFDPEQLIRDYEAGVPLDDLVRRPPLPPGKTPMDMRAETPRA